jgi:hypothetical protein
MVLGLILSHINPVYVPHDFKIRLNIQLKWHENLFIFCFWYVSN